MNLSPFVWLNIWLKYSCLQTASKNMTCLAVVICYLNYVIDQIITLIQSASRDYAVSVILFPTANQHIGGRGHLAGIVHTALQQRFKPEWRPRCAVFRQPAETTNPQKHTENTEGKPRTPGGDKRLCYSLIISRSTDGQTNSLAMKAPTKAPATSPDSVTGAAAPRSSLRRRRRATGRSPRRQKPLPSAVARPPVSLGWSLPHGRLRWCLPGFPEPTRFSWKEAVRPTPPRRTPLWLLRPASISPAPASGQHPPPWARSRPAPPWIHVRGKRSLTYLGPVNWWLTSTSELQG